MCTLILDPPPKLFFRGPSAAPVHMDKVRCAASKELIVSTGHRMPKVSGHYSLSDPIRWCL